MQLIPCEIVVAKFEIADNFYCMYNSLSLYSLHSDSALIDKVQVSEVRSRYKLCNEFRNAGSDTLDILIAILHSDT